MNSVRGKNDMSSFDFDGRPVPFTSGQTVGAALWADGVRSWRRTRFGGSLEVDTPKGCDEPARLSKRDVQARGCRRLSGAGLDHQRELPGIDESRVSRSGEAGVQNLSSLRAVPGGSAIDEAVRSKT